MKKFSKLIKESKSSPRKMDILTNPVDWEEIFKPLIEHIENNSKSNSNGPGDGVFSDSTKEALYNFLDLVDTDYAEYHINEIDDGSQESFLNAFNIDVDYRDIIDAIQPIMDRTEEIEENPSFERGVIQIESSVKYKSMGELLEDMEDIHLNLKLLNIDFLITIRRISGSTLIHKTDTNISELITKDWTDSWGKISNSTYLLRTDTNNIIIEIYNKDTVRKKK